MAIQIDFRETPYGVGFSKTYARIHKAEFHKVAYPHVLLHVLVYANKPINQQQQPIDQICFDIPWSEILAQPGNDFLAQCYAWLHKQPDFQVAEAV